MIDLHTHVLPGIDDGPTDVPSAAALLHAMAAIGVRCVVATPHVSDRHPNDPATIADALARLEAADAIPEGLELRLGAEVTLERALALDDDTLAQLRLGGGPWLLVECPLSPAAGDLDAPLARLRDRGHRLVLAHPERSPPLQRRPGRLLEYVAAGDVCAITAGAMAGRFGRTARRMSLHMLREGVAHAVSSDAHDLLGRPPGLLAGFSLLEEEQPGIAARARWHIEQVPAAILEGAPLPPPLALEPAPAPSRGRRRWRRRGHGTAA